MLLKCKFWKFKKLNWQLLDNSFAIKTPIDVTGVARQKIGFMAKRPPRVGPSSRSNYKNSSFLSKIDSYFDIKGKMQNIKLFGKEPSEIVVPYNKEQLDALLMFDENWQIAIGNYFGQIFASFPLQCFVKFYI